MAPILTMSFKSISVHVDIIKNHLAALLIAIRNCIRYIGLKSEWNTNAILVKLIRFPSVRAFWCPFWIETNIKFRKVDYCTCTDYIMAAILTKSFESIIVHVDIVFCTKYTLELQNGYQNTHVCAKVRNALHVLMYLVISKLCAQSCIHIPRIFFNSPGIASSGLKFVLVIRKSTTISAAIIFY